MRDFNSTEDLPSGLRSEDDVDFPAGWYFSPAVNITHWMSAVGEATGSYRNNFKVGRADLTISNDVRVYTFMGGPRIFHKTGRFVPYGQFLVGAAHARMKTTLPPALADYSLVGTISTSATDFAMQPGGGLMVFPTERVGVRVAADHRRIIDFDEDVSSNEFRVLTGFTFNLGRR